MLSFLSDRRVLSVSAALITAAIFLFLLGTYPSWRKAIKDGFSWSPSAPSAVQLAPSVPSNAAALASAPAAPQTTAPHGAAPAGAQTAVPPAPALTPLQPAVPAPTAVPERKASATDGRATPASESAAAALPSFDVVRVEPSGDSVVAARAKPGATVVLLDQGRPIANAKADANGQVAFVPPTLAPGEHSLMLSAGEPDAPGALSSQSVAVSVPQTAKAAPMVAVIQPDAPTRVLSDGASPPAGAAAQPAPAVSVAAIDVEEGGGVFASGKAAPGSHCRIYLNGSFVAPVTAGPDGRWSLKIEHGMKPGHYAVRVDQVGSAAGNVQARAEVPFDYPAVADKTASLLRPNLGRSAARAVTTLPAAKTPALGEVASAAPSGAAHAASALPTPGAAAQSADPTRLALAATPTDAASDVDPTAGSTVVVQLLTTKVVRGDSLWRISRKMLGYGRHYTQIYAVNTSQIRDPALIYPGQIFVMPQTQTP